MYIRRVFPNGTSNSFPEENFSDKLFSMASREPSAVMHDKRREALTLWLNEILADKDFIRQREVRQYLTDFFELPSTLLLAQSDAKPIILDKNNDIAVIVNSSDHRKSIGFSSTELLDEPIGSGTIVMECESDYDEVSSKQKGLAYGKNEDAADEIIIVESFCEQERQNNLSSDPQKQNARFISSEENNPSPTVQLIVLSHNEGEDHGEEDEKADSLVKPLSVHTSDRSLDNIKFLDAIAREKRVYSDIDHTDKRLEQEERDDISVPSDVEDGDPLDDVYIPSDVEDGDPLDDVYIPSDVEDGDPLDDVFVISNGALEVVDKGGACVRAGPDPNPFSVSTEQSTGRSDEFEEGSDHAEQGPVVSGHSVVGGEEAPRSKPGGGPGPEGGSEGGKGRTAEGTVLIVEPSPIPPPKPRKFKSESAADPRRDRDINNTQSAASSEGISQVSSPIPPSPSPPTRSEPAFLSASQSRHADELDAIAVDPLPAPTHPSASQATASNDPSDAPPEAPVILAPVDREVCGNRQGDSSGEPFRVLDLAIGTSSV